MYIWLPYLTSFISYDGDSIGVWPLPHSDSCDVAVVGVEWVQVVDSDLSLVG